MTYTGETNERGEPHGQGVFELANGERYEGQWKDGEPHQGVYKFANGDCYDGEWKDGERNGQGIMEFADGGRYEGQWKDSKPEGQGVCKYADGTRYEGQWKDGKRNGQGVMEYADGTRYEGQWKDGLWHGQGVAEWGPGQWEGDRYEGQWKDGLHHGQGVYKFANGDCYDGEWKDGLYHGQGDMIPESSSFKGVSEESSRWWNIFAGVSSIYITWYIFFIVREWAEGNQVELGLGIGFQIFWALVFLLLAAEIFRYHWLFLTPQGRKFRRFLPRSYGRMNASLPLVIKFLNGFWKFFISVSAVISVLPIAFIAGASQMEPRQEEWPTLQELEHYKATGSMPSGDLGADTLSYLEATKDKRKGI